MLTQKPAFNTRGKLWSYVTKGTPFPTSELQAVNTSAQGISFIQEVMAASPKKRLTAATAIGHDWLEHHEFLDEKRSRSSIESARELSTSVTSIGYEPSAQWTEISQEAEPTVKLGEDEPVTSASQSSAVEKVEAMVRQSERPSASTTIVAEDGPNMHGTISSTTTASDSLTSFNQTIKRQSEDMFHTYGTQPSSDTVMVDETHTAPSASYYQRGNVSGRPLENTLHTFGNQASPSTVVVDETHADSSVSHRQPGGLSGQAAVKGFLGSSEAVAANLSRLAIAPKGVQAVHSPRSDTPQGYSNHEEPRRSEPYIDVMSNRTHPQERVNSSPVYHQRYGSMQMNNRRPTAIPSYDQVAHLNSGSESPVDIRQSPTEPRPRMYQADYPEFEEYDGRLVGSSQGNRGVRHNNHKRFTDAYDLYDQYEYQGHEGSGGAAKRVMDFFRRRGKARADQDWL